MQKKLVRKIKNRLSLFSSIIFTTGIIAVVINPTSLLSLLPMIIPTGMLAIGIPTYTVIKEKKKEELENVNQPSIEKNIEVDNETTDKQVIRIYENFELQHNDDRRKEKVKVKTKGTIHY